MKSNGITLDPQSLVKEAKYDVTARCIILFGTDPDGNEVLMKHDVMRKINFTLRDVNNSNLESKLTRGGLRGFGDNYRSGIAVSYPETVLSKPCLPMGCVLYRQDVYSHRKDGYVIQLWYASNHHLTKQKGSDGANVCAFLMQVLLSVDGVVHEMMDGGLFESHIADHLDKFLISWLPELQAKIESA